MVTGFGSTRWSSIALVCALSSALAWSGGCSNQNDAAPNSNVGGSNLAGNASTTKTTAGGGSSKGGATSAGGSSNTRPCSSADMGTRTHDLGNFDYRSCNGAGCHDNWSGGWVYASATGVPWIGAATVTITNSDGSTDTAVSGSNGFFYLENTLTDTGKGAYIACVSKCPNTVCSATPHTNRDCLASGCHTSPTQRIYMPVNGIGGANGTGGSSAVGGGSCKPPTGGGPYVHASMAMGETDCSHGGCHTDPQYIGGFVFDGLTSEKSIAEATVTVTPSSGATLTAVTGPDGMFFFGKRNGASSTPDVLKAPYTACVSKCPKTVCSGTNSHTNTDDCSTCHDSTIRVYLQ